MKQNKRNLSKIADFYLIRQLKTYFYETQRFIKEKTPLQRGKNCREANSLISSSCEDSLDD
jgi:hypothetical protein